MYAEQLVERLGESACRVDFVVAKGSYDQHRHVRDRSRNMVEQRKSSFVGPVQILKKQQEGTAGRSSGQKFHHRVEKDPARLLGRQLQRRRNVGEEAPKLGHQASHFTRVGSQGRPECFRTRSLCHCGFENLHERAERQRILAVIATAYQGSESALRSFCRKLGGDSSLTDAQYSANHRDAALSCERALQKPAQDGTFGLTADERSAVAE